MSNRELRQFAVFMSSMIILIFGVVLPHLRKAPFPLPALVLALLILVPGLIYAPSIRWLYASWRYLGSKLAAIYGRVILILIFYLVITPIGWLRQGLGQDPLARGIEKEKKTYKIRRLQGDMVQRMEKIY